MDLNKKQKWVLQLFENNYNLFITGPGGTGKSFIVKKIIELYSEKNNASDIVITSTTGISALNIGGKTIHSWSGIFPDTNLEDPDKFVLHIKKNHQLLNQWQYTKVLIIDEISMLSPQMLDFINSVAQLVRGKSSPFGGIQVIITGDFYQLPPVSENSSDFAFEAKCWESLIDYTIELTENHRQNNLDLVNFLKSVRKGKITDNVKQKLQEFQNNSNYESGYTHLYSCKNSVYQHNRKMLDKIPGQSVDFKAKIIPRDKSKKTKYDFPNDSIIAPYLSLKPDCFIIINKNIDFDKGLVNGSQGKLLTINEKQLTIQLANQSVHTINKHQWEFKNYYVEQFPVLLAWALTIHKSQGMGINKLSVDIGDVFNCGQAYVALSRAINVEYLHISNYSISNIRVDPKVDAYYKSLNAKKNKWNIIVNNGKQFYQNCLSGIIKSNKPKGEIINLDKIEQNIEDEIIIESNLLCQVCQKKMLQRDYEEWFGEKICTHCICDNRDYQLLSVKEINQKYQGKVTQKRIRWVLSDLLHKPQYNKYAMGTVKTKLYLQKHVVEVMNKEFTSESETTILDITKDKSTDNKIVVSSQLEKNITTQLRIFRHNESKARECAPFYIFSNKVMGMIAKSCPISEEELVKIKGIGGKKLEDFGTEIIKICIDSKKQFPSQLKMENFTTTK